MERLINSAWHVQRPRRDVVATAAPLARGRAGSRRFFRESADNVRLDPQGKLAYVGYGDGALAVIDPQQMKKIGDVKLDAIPKHSSWIEVKGREVAAALARLRELSTRSVDGSR